MPCYSSRSRELEIFSPTIPLFTSFILEARLKTPFERTCTDRHGKPLLCYSKHDKKLTCTSSATFTRLSRCYGFAAAVLENPSIIYQPRAKIPAYTVSRMARSVILSLPFLGIRMPSAMESMVGAQSLLKLSCELNRSPTVITMIIVVPSAP